MSRFTWCFLAAVTVAAISIVALAIPSPVSLIGPEDWPRILLEPFALEAAASHPALALAVTLLAIAILFAVARVVWLRAGPGSWLQHARRYDRERRPFGGWSYA